MAFVFVTLFYLQGFSQLCEQTQPSSAQNSKVLQAAQKVSCPTCPYENESETLVITKKFDRSSADDVVKELMRTVTTAISRSSNISPDCAFPCKKNHKALPIIKITPQEIDTRVVCEEIYIKTHTLTKVLSSTGSDDTCKKDVNEQTTEWIRHTLVSPSLPWPIGRKATDEGRNLLKSCPSACSYYSTQVFDYTYNKDNNKCDLNLTLLVKCGPSKLSADFIGKGYIRDHLSCTK